MTYHVHVDGLVEVLGRDLCREALFVRLDLTPDALDRKLVADAKAAEKPRQSGAVSGGRGKKGGNREAACTAEQIAAARLAGGLAHPKTAREAVRESVRGSDGLGLLKRQHFQGSVVSEDRLRVHAPGGRRFVHPKSVAPADAEVGTPTLLTDAQIWGAA